MCRSRGSAKALRQRRLGSREGNRASEDELEKSGAWCMLGLQPLFVHLSPHFCPTGWQVCGGLRAEMKSSS